MAGFTDTFENGFLDLLLRGTAIADIAQNDTTGPATTFYFSLHTADPTDTGSQTSSEVTYTSYAREACSRVATYAFNAASGGSSALAADEDFTTGTGGSGTVTHFGLGKSLTGAGTLILSGTVTPNIVTGNGVTPRLSGTTTTIALD